MKVVWARPGVRVVRRNDRLEVEEIRRRPGDITVWVPASRDRKAEILSQALLSVMAQGSKKAQ